jgi:S1-C subfamily serine protease
VFNAKGKVVGMVQSIVQTETSQGERRCSRFAFAVPGHLVERIVTDIIKGTQSGFPRIGIGMTAAKVGIRWRVAVSKASGPAKRGGIRKGDILLSIDGTDISSAAQLKNHLIERKAPGQQVTIRVLRGEEEKPLLVTLGKYKKEIS